MTALGRPRIEPVRESREMPTALVFDRPCGGIDVGLLVMRAAMGAFFLLAGYAKMQMEPGAWLEQYAAVVSDAGFTSLPPWLTVAYGQAIPFLEMSVGAMLIVGLFGRLAGGVGALMVVTFTVALVAGAMPPDTAEAPRSLFSRITQPLAPHNGSPFHANIIFAAVMLLFLFAGAGRIGFDGLLFGRRSRGKKAE